MSIVDQQEYCAHYREEEYINQLPVVVVPNSTQFQLIAIEVDDSENMPIGYDFKSGDMLILERIVKENIHRIPNRFGMRVNKEGIKAGIFKEKDQCFHLQLNELVDYPFDLDSENQYWALKATYCYH